MAQSALSTHAMMLEKFGVKSAKVNPVNIQEPTAKVAGEKNHKESHKPGLSLEMIMQECMIKKAGPQNTPAA